MSSLGYWDILKLSYRVIQFRLEQRKLATTINPIIKTPNGSLKGVKRLTTWGDEYLSFEKIPYAKPPVDDLRFKAPVPAEPWENILDCTGPADVPLQVNMVFKKFKGSEDCLYLNVFTKNVTPEKPRPVMVWLYGGGFQLGEATRDLYSPDFFMSKDVVLVTVAYRLGPFGFLNLDDPTADVPGNAGIKDQILSLKWVQENIAAFGGDPNNVTVFGESAGAVSAHLCMMSEKSKGLLHKGIVMSGTALCSWAFPPKNQWAFRLAKILGYAGENKDSEVLNFLREAKGSDIVVAAGRVLDNKEKHHRYLFAFTPVVEPYTTEHSVLTEHPYELMKTTWSNEIPMMLGGTSFEGLLFHSEVIRRPATLNEVKNCTNLVPNDLGLPDGSKELEEIGLKIKSTYFGDEECNLQNIMKFLELESYRAFWHPIYRTALSRLQHSKAPTYLYRFDYDSLDGNSIRNLLCSRDIRGACHGDDMCYLYRSVLSYRAPQDSEEHRIIQTMIDIWTSFAAKSDPNCDSLHDLKIEPLSKDSEMKCLNISDKSEFINLPELQKIKVWNSFYPLGKL